MILIRVNALLQKIQFQRIQPKEAVVPAAAQPPGSTVSEHFCRHVQVCSGQTVCRLTCHITLTLRVYYLTYTAGGGGVTALWRECLMPNHDAES